MKYNFIKTFAIACVLMPSVLCCKAQKESVNAPLRHDYANIIDISLTPDGKTKQTGCFSDQGSWMGFTMPQKDKWINGFCGPFGIYSRKWFAKSIAEIGFLNEHDAFHPDSTSYFPGELYLSSACKNGKIEQRLIFVDHTTALLRINSKQSKEFEIKGNTINKELSLIQDMNTITMTHPNGEVIMLTFPSDMKVYIKNDNYYARTSHKSLQTCITISFLTTAKEMIACKQNCLSLLNDPSSAIKLNEERWNGYLHKVLRPNISYAYNRIAVKAIVTLISNWRAQRGGILHDAIIPSHAVGYFIGCWAWDCWRFSAAIASFFPELAKDNIRAMFDYQLSDGMVIDCIYPDSKENNARDSKPPLACWAVNAIFEQTKDTAFVKEMYPQLLSYYKWWYQKRDHNHNGICEFGSVDGTLEAAAWESGMDNAIRFDDAIMLKNEDNAWSVDQESVDLNSYLALECTLLQKFAGIINQPFDGPDYRNKIATYFFDSKIGYFCDKRLKDNNFIEEPGCEGYIPLWTNIASKNQFEKVVRLLENKNKFSTYIPFPTIAADNPKYDANGYWRGPIWLDQTYFAIKGFRNYGEKKKADAYTEQVFNRLQGLTGTAPIYENYDTHSGKALQSSHFSWSAAHLLLLYRDYKNK